MLYSPNLYWFAYFLVAAQALLETTRATEEWLSGAQKQALQSAEKHHPAFYKPHQHPHRSHVYRLKPSQNPLPFSKLRQDDNQQETNPDSRLPMPKEAYQRYIPSRICTFSVMKNRFFSPLRIIFLNLLLQTRILTIEWFECNGFFSCS